jgi:hypothetical protein
MVTVLLHSTIRTGSQTCGRMRSSVNKGTTSCCCYDTIWVLNSPGNSIVRSEVRCITTYLSIIDNTSWIIEGVHGFSAGSTLHSFRSFTRWLEEVLS